MCAVSTFWRLILLNIVYWFYFGSSLVLLWQLTVLLGAKSERFTWYKITYTGEQVAQWDFQNNAPAFVLEVPQRNLLTSICNFVPCDQVVQRAYN